MVLPTMVVAHLRTVIDPAQFLFQMLGPAATPPAGEPENPAQESCLNMVRPLFTQHKCRSEQRIASTGPASGAALIRRAAGSRPGTAAKAD